MPISYLSSNRNVGEVNMYKINFHTMILWDKVNYLWIGFKNNNKKKNPPWVPEEFFGTIQLNGGSVLMSSHQWGASSIGIVSILKKEYHN